jgi:hypothetical protein
MHTTPTSTSTPGRSVIARHASVALFIIAGIATCVACICVLRALTLGPLFIKQTDHAIRDMMERGLLNRELYAQQYLATHGTPSKIKVKLPNDPVGFSEVSREFISDRYIGEQGPWLLTALAAAPLSLIAAFAACCIVDERRRHAG